MDFSNYAHEIGRPIEDAVRQTMEKCQLTRKEAERWMDNL